MFKRASRNGAVPLIGVLALSLAGVAQADSVSAGSIARMMTLGDAALPPLGFLDLCERAPVECTDDQASIPDLTVLRAAANRRFWQDAFARRSEAPAALGVATPAFDWTQAFSTPRRATEFRITPRLLVSAPTPTMADEDCVEAISAESVSVVALDVAAAPINAAFASAADEAGDAVVLAIAASRGETFAAAAAAAAADAGEEAGAPAPAPPEPARFELDRAGWALVNGVNRRVNRQILQMADDRQYGKADYWARPVGPGARGDCEDYVLAKRRALIAEGVPAAALSIAIVETRWGESHAVLLIASEGGEYVLDNLTPWVSRWDRVNYVWRERQRPGNPFDWVRAAI